MTHRWSEEPVMSVFVFAAGQLLGLSQLSVLLLFFSMSNRRVIRAADGSLLVTGWEYLAGGCCFCEEAKPLDWREYSAALL